MFRAMKFSYVYILASRRNGTLYTGVTSDLVARIWQHREDVLPGFSRMAASSSYGSKFMTILKRLSERRSRSNAGVGPGNCGWSKNPILAGAICGTISPLGQQRLCLPEGRALRFTGSRSLRERAKPGRRNRERCL